MHKMREVIFKRAEKHELSENVRVSLKMCDTWHFWQVWFSQSYAWMTWMVEEITTNYLRTI